MKRDIAAVVVLVTLAMLSHAMILSENAEAPGPWNTQTVAFVGNVGSFPSMLINSTNTPHIAFADYTNQALKHAVWTGVSWNVETIESGIRPLYINLVSAKDDTLHVGYLDYFTDAVKHAHKDGASWSVEVVDYPTGNQREYVSMDLDSNDIPHFAYVDIPVENNNSLIYTNKTGGSWKSQLVSWVNGSGYSQPGVSIAMDSKDRPRIMWSGFSNLVGVHHLEWSGTSWSDEMLDDDLYYGLPEGCFPDMALDSNDVPYIAFCELSSPYDEAWDARVAYKLDGSWTFETFDIGLLNPKGAVGQFFSIAFDSFDRPHVTYTDWGGGDADTLDLFYAFRSDFGWIVERADPGKITRSSIAIDHCDMPHVAYREFSVAGASDADLKHAWKDCSTPYPDLTLSPSDISFSPPSPVLNGTSVTIEAVVHNSGVAVAADITVRVHDGTPSPSNQIDGDVIIPVLIAGSTDTIQVQWNASPPGDHDVCVSVDPENSITEINELNNEACAMIQVYSPQPPAPPSMIEAHLSGMDSEYVTITWSLSPDDLGGLGNVVRYDVLRGEQYGSEMSGYTVLDSVPSGMSTYVDEYAGEGDPDNHFYVACAVNAIGNSSCSDNQAGKFTRPLIQGPNLVSVPLVQSDENVETVLQTVEYDKAWTYDPSSREWNWHMTFKQYRRGLWNVNHSMGLWVNVTQQSNLTIAGLVPTSTHIHLYEGWNLVGFPFFDENYSIANLRVQLDSSRVEGLDFIDPYHLKLLSDSDTLQAGNAYWIRVESETVWTLVND